MFKSFTAAYNFSGSLLCAMMGLMLISGSVAAEYYQQPADFIESAFPGTSPASSKIWLKKDIKQEIKKIMGHDLGVLRLKYWWHGNRSAWILDEIGKDKPITAGIIVHEDKIETIKVLAFRESRGWEIRYPFFTDQFNGAVLQAEQKLDRSIDGISGATLSVRAMKKMARLALFLHRKARDHKTQ